MCFIQAKAKVPTMACQRPNVICSFIFPLPLCHFPPSAPPPSLMLLQPCPGSLLFPEHNKAQTLALDVLSSVWKSQTSSTTFKSLCSDVIFSKEICLPTLFETAVPSTSTPNRPYLALFLSVVSYHLPNILSSLLVVCVSML